MRNRKFGKNETLMLVEIAVRCRIRPICSAILMKRCEKIDNWIASNSVPTTFTFASPIAILMFPFLVISAVQPGSTKIVLKRRKMFIIGLCLKTAPVSIDDNRRRFNAVSSFQLVQQINFGIQFTLFEIALCYLKKTEKRKHATGTNVQ